MKEKSETDILLDLLQSHRILKRKYQISEDMLLLLRNYMGNHRIAFSHLPPEFEKVSVILSTFRQKTEKELTKVHQAINRRKQLSSELKLFYSTFDEEVEGPENTVSF